MDSFMNRVYLDFNATTPVEPAVLDAMLPFFSAEFANAASIHTPGQRARAAVETAREQVAALIRARPQEIIFTSMHANNELGAVQRLEEIGRTAKEADVYFRADAVQSAGKIPIDVNTLQVDLLSISGHKLYAPKGIGALYVRGGTRLRQLLYGGHHQRGFRPGTENVAGIVGLGKAAEIALKFLADDAQRISALRDKLQQGLLQRVPHSRVNAGAAPRTPNTTNLVFPGVEGEALLIALDVTRVACSTGAACSSGAVEPSHVLTAIGLPPEEARASLRFSLGRPTTSADIDFALNVVPAAVAQLRELSPTYQKAVAHE